MNTVLASLVLLPSLVASPKAPPEPEDVKAGWLGLLVFLLLVAAVIFLGRSLRKHLGKVDFDESDPAEPRSDAPSTSEHRPTNGSTPSP